MKLTLLFGRICSGKSSLYKDSYRIVVSDLVRGIINSTSREELQNTMHLDSKIAESIVMVIDNATEHSHIVVDGIRQATIVNKVLQHHPDTELVWLEVPVEERKRRYEARGAEKDTEPFEVADNKPIELECQDIFRIFKQQLRVINN